MTEVICPLCHCAEHLVYHASYRKYFYERLITIIRVMCTKCGITHAIIPLFSLPGTSIGTAEAENYLKERAEGASRTKAGRCFFRARDVRTVPGFFRKDDVTMCSQHESPAPVRRGSVPHRIRVSCEPEKIIAQPEWMRADYARERYLSS
jgi:hypothetical protein